MPPKEDDLLAVLLADSFDSCFADFGQSTALLPIANVKSIDYSLEFLERAGVKETVVFSTFHSEALKHYIDARWKSGVMKVIVFASSTSRSLGDALRELDRTGTLAKAEDFVLVQSGVVCSADLQKSIKEHRARRAKDTSYVLTLCFRECDPNHRIRSRGNDTIVAYEKRDSRLLFQQKLRGNTASVQIDYALIDSNEIAIRLDLLHCGISICSKQIPALFQDNFDYHTFDDLVKEIIENEEILAQKILVSLFTTGYAASFRDFNSYCALNEDVLARWAFPFCPDMGVSPADVENTYSYAKKNVYIHKDGVVISRDTTMISSAVGAKSILSERAHLERTVIGDNCRVGRDSRLHNCVVWNSVHVGERCTLRGPLLVCDGALIGDDCVIGERCVIGPNYKLAAKSNVPSGSVLVGTMGTSVKTDSSADVVAPLSYKNPEGHLVDSLARSLDAWRALPNVPAHVLDWIENGAPLFFRAGVAPPSAFELVESKQQFSADEEAFLDTELVRLCTQGVVEQVTDGEVCCVSPLKLKAKRDKPGEFRIILDLRQLNSFVREDPPVKQDIKQVRRDLAMTTEDRLVTWDLKSATTHLRMCVDARKYLGFVWRRVRYRYVTLPQGLVCTNTHFAQILEPVVKYLREEGIRVASSFDDFILAAPLAMIERQRDVCLETFRRLGFFIAFDKSSLIPDGTKEFIGHRVVTGMPEARPKQIKQPPKQQRKVPGKKADTQREKLSSNPDDAGDDVEQPSAAPKSEGWPVWYRLVPSADAESPCSSETETESDDEKSNKGGQTQNKKASDDESTDDEDEELKHFYDELVENLSRAVDENLQWDTLKPIINSAKLAHNVSMNDLQRLLVKAMLDAFVRIVGRRTGADAKFKDVTLQKVVDRLHPLVNSYVKNDAQAERTCLLAVEEFSKEQSLVREMVVKVLKYMYDADVVSEASILAWHDKLAQGSVLRTKLAAFVNWLREAESESESESE